MFTGIITRIGTIAHIDKSGDWRLRIACGDFAVDAASGASIACSGVCLTITEKETDGFWVQVSQETLARTTLADVAPGMRLNLERALKVGDELGGHFVSGHVDGLAVLESVTPAQDSKALWFSCAPGKENLIRFIAPKGSVTLDGVSLTVNEVTDERFAVNIIPHTLEHTTLGERKVGDKLNLEIDLLARYLMRLKEVV